jgi:hypothetical protein
LTKTKTLWSDKKGVFRIIDKVMVNGDLVLNKMARINVGNLENATISYPDKMVNALAVLGGTLAALFAAILLGPYGYIATMPVFIIAVLVTRAMFMRRIFYPLICARWNSSQPFDILNAKPSKAYVVKEKTQVQKMSIEFRKSWKFIRLGKKKVWKTVKTKMRDIGKLEFVEMRLAVPDGISVVTPENYEHLHRNVALETMLKPEKGSELPWLFMFVFAMLGFFLAIALFPHGFEAFIQQMQQTAGQAAGAVAPSNGQSAAPAGG